MNFISKAVGSVRQYIRTDWASNRVRFCTEVFAWACSVVSAVMFAATAVAVVAKSTENATEPEVTVTPFTVTLFTEPAPPPVKTTVPVAPTATGVRSVTMDGDNEVFMVNRLT